MMVKPIFWVGIPMLWNFIRLTLILVITGFIGILAGCQSNNKLATSYKPDSAQLPTSGPSYIRPSEPDLFPTDADINISSLSPDAMTDYYSIQYTPITLAECISRALRDSEVFRDLGGTMIVRPAAVSSSMDPALRYTDPTSGEDAALSAFDANVVSGVFLENNDRPFNNRFSGDTDGILQQDLGEFKFEVSKLAATGTLFTSRSTINYDHNNQAGNRFEGSAWEAIIDTGFRHPLMQGSGSMFNRIAGPSQVPGSYNGVLIARTNTEISLADFEESSRQFVSNVENAYWDLYYAYRELNAQTEARDAALEVLKKTKAEAANERISGLEQASAEEQYLRFESAIIESLEGRLIEGTQVDSGSSGGSFRRTVGVRVAERRLRYLIGMPITDGSLLQPAEQPGRAASIFDWDSVVASALTRRPETRRQRWVVKQKELELTAARNYLLPRFDLVGNYRFRGLGKSLTGGGESLRDDINSNATAFNAESGAFSDLASGDFQELQLGAELRMPVGYRRANAAVRNAELAVQREHSIMKEQERKIVLNLSNAIAEARRAHSAMMIAEKRFEAAEEYRAQAAARIDSGRSQMDVLLEAQRRMLESQIQFLNSEVDYVIAIKNVHYEKGTFLEYHGVALSESESDPRAYIDHDRRVAGREKLMSYVVRDASIGRSPLADAAYADETAVEFVNVPMVESPLANATIIDAPTGLPVGSQFATEVQSEIPLGTGIALPMTDSPPANIPTTNPLEGNWQSPPTPGAQETIGDQIEFNPPPSAGLAPGQPAMPNREVRTALSDLPIRTIVSDSPIRTAGTDSPKRVVLSDIPVREIPAPPATQPANAVFGDQSSTAVTANLSSRKTNATPDLQSSNGGKRVYLADIPIEGISMQIGSGANATANLTDQQTAKLSDQPVTMNLSSSRKNNSAVTKPASASFGDDTKKNDDKPGFTILQPMLPSPDKAVAKESGTTSKSNSPRVSDSTSQDVKEPANQIR